MVGTTQNQEKQESQKLTLEKSKQEDSRAQNHSQDAQTVLHRPPINSEPGAASVRDQAGDADRAGDRERTNQLLDEYNELKKKPKESRKKA